MGPHMKSTDDISEEGKPLKSLLSSLKLLVGIWLRPVDTLKECASATRFGPAAWLMGLVGLAHGAFSFLLFLHGHQPSFPSPLIPAHVHFFVSLSTVP